MAADCRPKYSVVIVLLTKWNMSCYVTTVEFRQLE